MHNKIKIQKKEGLPLVNSLSGGMSSSMCASEYGKGGANVFALVRSENACTAVYDKKIVQLVEDRIQKPFIGTLEQPGIIFTMLDLEQFLGERIHWVSGITYEELVRTKGGLPNSRARYCTHWLKIEPIFQWCYERYNISPVFMNIGYRVNEGRRVEKKKKELDLNGFDSFKSSVSLYDSGRWKGHPKREVFKWRKVGFPLYDNGITKEDVRTYWKGKNIRFTQQNNCVGCFHRSVNALMEQSVLYPEQFQAFVEMEASINSDRQAKTRVDGNFRPIIGFKKNASYQKIASGAKKNNYILLESPMAIQEQQVRGLEHEGCGSGFCGF